MTSPNFSGIHLEKVDLATFGKGAHIVSIASPSKGEGVTTVTDLLAKRSAEIGKKTLLVLFSNNFNRDELKYKPWKIGLPPSPFVYKRRDGSFFMHVEAPETDILKWADPLTINRFFTVMKSNFERIIVDLPPLTDRILTEVSPVPIAAGADCLMLVALSGHLSSVTAKDLVTDLEHAGVKISGILLNDKDYPTVGMELARQADKLKKYAPKLMTKLSDKARQSEFLNLHI